MKDVGYWFWSELPREMHRKWWSPWKEILWFFFSLVLSLVFSEGNCFPTHWSSKSNECKESKELQLCVLFLNLHRFVFTFSIQKPFKLWVVYYLAIMLSFQDVFQTELPDTKLLHFACFSLFSNYLFSVFLNFIFNVRISFGKTSYCIVK